MIATKIEWRQLKMGEHYDFPIPHVLPETVQQKPAKTTIADYMPSEDMVEYVIKIQKELKELKDAKANLK